MAGFQQCVGGLVIPPFQFERVMSSIDAFTTGRGRGEGPRRKSGRGTETAGTDAIDGLNSNRVDGVRSGKKNCKIHHRVWKLSEKIS